MERKEWVGSWNAARMKFFFVQYQGDTGKMEHGSTLYTGNEN